MSRNLTASESKPVCPHSPTGLHYARNMALQRLVTEADAAETKAPHIPARAAAHPAAVADAHAVFPSRFLDHHRLLCHNSLSRCPLDYAELACEPASPILTTVDRGDLAAALRSFEWHIQQSQHPAGFLIGLGRRDDCHFQAAHPVDAVVIDLREDQLLAQANAVIAATVE